MPYDVEFNIDHVTPSGQPPPVVDVSQSRYTLASQSSHPSDGIGVGAGDGAALGAPLGGVVGAGDGAGTGAAEGRGDAVGRALTVGSGDGAGDALGAGVGFSKTSPPDEQKLSWYSPSAPSARSWK